MPAALQIAGKKFGRLLVIERAHQEGARNAMWRCLCDCGNQTIAAAANIGRTTFSCGCFNAETGAQTLAVNRTKRAGLHGMSAIPEYSVWGKMLQRCYNPNSTGFHKYGGRGISVCARWRDSFEFFLADMGHRPSDKHSIERLNNDGPYSPANCIWATQYVQARNRRNTHHVSIDGTSKCVKDWASLLGVARHRFSDMARPTFSDGTRRKNIRFRSIDEAILHIYREKIEPTATLTE